MPTCIQAGDTILAAPVSAAVIYFYVASAVFAFSLSGIAIPIIQGEFNLPVGNIDGVHYYVPTLALPLVVVGGILLWTLYTDLEKFIVKLHGRYVKAMLGSE